jgi:HKD family nuclease
MAFTLILSPDSLQREFAELVTRCRRIQLVVAWATKGYALDLLSKTAKARRIEVESFVGTTFDATDPDAVEDLLRLGKVYVDTRGDRVFHPKLFVFHLDHSLEIIVGSANLTNAAFRRNFEICVRLRMDEGAAEDLSRRIRRLRNELSPITSRWLDTYRKQYKGSLANVLRRRLEIEGFGDEDAALEDGGDQLPADENLLDHQWNEYYRALRERTQGKQGQDYLFDDPDSYLGCLNRLRPLIRRRFDQLDCLDTRKVLGDTIGGVDYGWFGSVTANGRMKHHLMSTATLRRDLGRLLPPLVAARDELAALRAGAAVNSRMTREAGIGPAGVTRLLVLARPDMFFSVNGKSVDALAKLLHTRPADLKRWDGYVEALKTVWNSPWYRSPRPIDPGEVRAWEARVGLLDAYAYKDEFE